MGIARSTFYDDPTAALDDTAIVEAIAAICDEFEAYGWRRVAAAVTKKEGGCLGVIFFRGIQHKSLKSPDSVETTRVKFVFRKGTGCGPLRPRRA